MVLGLSELNAHGTNSIPGASQFVAIRSPIIAQGFRRDGLYARLRVVTTAFVFRAETNPAPTDENVSDGQ
jgi:hypothetical protein